MKSISFLLLLFLFPLCLMAQDYAVERLENSPRHHEWVKLQVSEDRTLNCFVVYPEKDQPTKAVLVIHENRGLNDWARSLADQIAEAGYLAIAPDLLSDFDEEHQMTSDFENSDAARTALYKLDSDQITTDLNKAFDYAFSLGSVTGEIAVMGFCWGGSQSFRYATNNTSLSEALVFYGTAPKEKAVFEKIETPVYGFYGSDDQRVNASIANTEKLMGAFGKTYEYIIYKGAGHAFMRRGDDPEETGPNKTARDRAWERVKEILED